MRVFVTHSPQETVELGKAFAVTLSAGDVVGLSGNLGSGKTQFVAGVCDGLGVQHRAVSPTFTLINEYEGQRVKVIHVDLYRIERQAELAELGVEEYFTDQCICLIEWAEKAFTILPTRYRMVKIRYGRTDTEREIEVDDAARVPA